jgi:hydroxymethylbilane synthase
MIQPEKPVLIATRGSALALAQANMVLAQCQAAFPEIHFELRIIKTTGDKLQTAALAGEGAALPKGLFTKELEVALLQGQADLAVHSLKDLPTELPAGLLLAAVTKRADVRDVLIYRDSKYHSENPEMLLARGFKPGLQLADLPPAAVVATSSTRRKALLLTANPGLKVPDIRGNVATRLQKLAAQPELDATILALAGICRLQFAFDAAGRLSGTGVPPGLLASILSTDEMLPCVGQGAIGIETRENDSRIADLCSRLNHVETMQCVTAERAFLAGMGGGCQSPVAAHAELFGDQLRLRALSFVKGPVSRAEASRPAAEASALGLQLAHVLR